jgi:hypothetical protein
VTSVRTPPSFLDALGAFAGARLVDQDNQEEPPDGYTVGTEPEKWPLTCVSEGGLEPHSHNMLTRQCSL